MSGKIELIHFCHFLFWQIYLVDKISLMKYSKDAKRRAKEAAYSQQLRDITFFKVSRHYSQ